MPKGKTLRPMFWIAAAAMGLVTTDFGGRVTQATAVLPSAVAAMAVALSVCALGRRLFGTDSPRMPHRC
jgi:4-amino-4-deoxy-L-arabinose transferase-like glycosyltransferase